MLHPALKLWLGSRAKVPNRLGTWLWGFGPLEGLGWRRRTSPVSSPTFNFSGRQYKLGVFVCLGVSIILSMCACVCVYNIYIYIYIYVYIDVYRKMCIHMLFSLFLRISLYLVIYRTSISIIC